MSLNKLGVVAGLTSCDRGKISHLKCCNHPKSKSLTPGILIFLLLPHWGLKLCTSLQFSHSLQLQWVAESTEKPKQDEAQRKAESKQITVMITLLYSLIALVSQIARPRSWKMLTLTFEPAWSLKACGVSDSVTGHPFRFTGSLGFWLHSFIVQICTCYQVLHSVLFLVPALRELAV